MTIRRRAILTVVLVGACWIVGAVIGFYEFFKYFAASGREPKPLADIIMTALAFALSPALWLIFFIAAGSLSGSGDAAMIPRVVVQTAVQAVVIYSILSRSWRTR
jgi:hypothetical protein